MRSTPLAVVRYGFTLIELLVVIAVIAILAGILAPVFARSRRAAQQQVCSSNLRQIGMAVRMYVDDHDDIYPIGAYLDGTSPFSWNVSWHNELTAYMKGLQPLFCPTAPHGSGYRVCYGCNARVSGWGWGISEAELSDFSRIVYASEKQDEDWPAFPPSTISLPHYKPLVPRHDGALMVLYCDGHVKSVPLRQAEGPNTVWQIEQAAVGTPSRRALKPAKDAVYGYARVTKER